MRSGRLPLLVLTAITFIVSSCSPAREPPLAPPSSTLQLMGYHVWWMGDAWQEADLAALDEVLFFELRVGENGTIEQPNGWPDRWRDLIGTARDQGSLVVPTISASDPDLFIRVFSSGLRTRLLLESTMDAVRDAEADGVHLDFEIFRSVPSEVRGQFIEFVEALRSELDSYRSDSRLTVFALAFDQGDVLDESRLSQIADYLVVQGYDLHWRTGDSAGPVAPIRGWGNSNWEAILGRFIALGVDRSKIIMSIPLFGYEWPTESEKPGARTRGPGITITYAPVDSLHLTGTRPNVTERIAAYGALRDASSGSPYYAYQDSTGWFQGWYEDPQSIAEKIEFVKREGLAGVAVFPLGYDNGALLRQIQSSLVSYQAETK